jgi:hypothetical protein
VRPAKAVAGAAVAATAVEVETAATGTTNSGLVPKAGRVPTGAALALVDPCAPAMAGSLFW